MGPLPLMFNIHLNGTIILKIYLYLPRPMFFQSEDSCSIWKNIGLGSNSMVRALNHTSLASHF